MERFTRVQNLERNDVKYFVYRIVGTDDPNEAHHSRLKIEVLPRSTIVLGVIYDSRPIFLVYRHFDEVRVRSAIRNQSSHTWNDPNVKYYRIETRFIYGKMSPNRFQHRVWSRKFASSTHRKSLSHNSNLMWFTMHWVPSLMRIPGSSAVPIQCLVYPRSIS